MSWNIYSAIGLPILFVSIGAGYLLWRPVRRRLKRSATFVAAVVFGVLFTVFGSPSVLPMPGAGHGNLAIIVPAWLTLLVYGWEILITVPIWVLLPFSMTFLIATSGYAVCRRRHQKLYNAEPVAHANAGRAGES